MTTPAEQLHRGLQKGPLLTAANSSPNQWAGRTTLPQSNATVIVSTFQVNSDSLIFATAQHTTAQNSGMGSPVCVRSINPGQGFVLGWADGSTAHPAATVMWEMKKTS